MREVDEMIKDADQISNKIIRLLNKRDDIEHVLRVHILSKVVRVCCHSTGEPMQALEQLITHIRRDLARDIKHENTG